VACKVFGLTGGIGAGKSTVAARFRARKLPVIDADQLARSVVAPHSEGYHALLEAFGEQILHEDRTIDRAKLARLVFGDRELRQRLEAVVHPRVEAALEVELRRLELREEPLACYEAALLVETGRAERFRPLIVVTAPEDVQVVRALHRDDGDTQQILQRIQSQAPTSDKVAVADYVIENAAELEDTIQRADRVLDDILLKLALDPSRYPRPPEDAA